MDRFNTPATYAIWSRNDDIRFYSTSGGAFSEFAKVILADGGLVVGARYNKENLVQHAIVDNYAGIEELRQSKYLSSSVGDCYKRVKEELLKGKFVAFCGSPCQVAGLYSFLGKEYDKLFTMDFICRGMNSPKAYKAWLNQVEKQENSKAIRVWFKYKDGGWKTSPRRTRVDFVNGQFKVFEAEKNLYMHGYLTSNLYIRPCCGNCQFKGIPRKSDVTLADFWGIEKEYDDDKGTSMLLVNSEKGRIYFERVKENLIVHQRDFETIFAGNPMFSTSVTVPTKCHDFLICLDKMSFSQAIKKYTRVSLWRRIVCRAKRVLKKALEK